MKKLLFILIFPLLCNAIHRPPIFDIPSKVWMKIPDDAKHYYAGALISFGTGWAVWKITDDNTLALTTGILFGVGSGLAKEEIYDRGLGRGVPSLEDKLVTGWGAFGGAIALRVKIGIHDKKKRKQEEEIENFILKYNPIYL